MVAYRIMKLAKRIPAALGAVLVLGLAQPAIAGSAGSADVVTPLEKSGNTYVSPLGQGDSEFRRIFTDWAKTDRVSSPLPTIATPAVSISSISIPSISPLVSSRMTSGYGMRRHPIKGGRRNHKGVDLAAPTGTPVYATADGVVSRANWFSSYGKYISIEHGGDIQTRFAHLSRIAVRNGQRVSKRRSDRLCWFDWPLDWPSPALRSTDFGQIGESAPVYELRRSAPRHADL